MNFVKILLTKVAGPEAVADEDAVWQQLASSAANPLSSRDPRDLEALCAPFWTLLVVNNHHTGNFQSLLRQSSALLSGYDNKGSLDAAINAVCLLTSLFKYCCEKLDPPRLLAFAELQLPSTPNSAASEQPNGAITDFVVRALTTLCDRRDSTGKSYALHLELHKLLLAMCSSQLYTPSAAGPPGSHPLVDLLLAQQQFAARVVQTCLSNFISRPAPPRDAPIWMGPGSDGRFSAVGRVAVSVLRLPMAVFSRPDSSALADCPLAHASVLLFLVLLHHTSVPRPMDGLNPVQRALQRLRDVEEEQGGMAADPEAGTGGGAAAAALSAGVPLVPFRLLYNVFGSLGVDEHCAMVLYSLLRLCPQFQEYVLSRTDLDTLLLPVLRLLYAQEEDGLEANHMYMLLIVILILSQDASFSASVHRLIIPGSAVVWYQERSVSRISLGSLLVLVLCRTAQYNMFKLKDSYLHTSTLAALTNLAPHVSGLTSMAAQRLVSLTDRLARHYTRLMEKVQRTPPTDAVLLAVLGSDLEMYGDCLRMLLEVLSILGASGLQANPELLYALLHKQDTFALLAEQPRFAELVQNIQCVFDYFNPRLDEAREERPDWTVEGVHQVLRKDLQKWRPDKLRALAPDLRFTYEEEAAPEEFFVPYVWSLVVQHSRLPWNLRAIALGGFTRGF